MTRLNEDFLKRAIEYTNRTLGEEPQNEETDMVYSDRQLAEEAITSDDVGHLYIWQQVVRAYYDACVEMSAQKEVDVADKHEGCSSCQGTGWVNGEPGNSCDIPSARISDTERPPVRSEDEP